MSATRVTGIGEQSELARGAQLFGLFAMALGQPLLELIANNAAFLVAHRAAPMTIWAMAVGLLVGPPVLIWIVEAGAARLSPVGSSWLRASSTGALTAVICLPIANSATGFSGITTLWISVGTGALVAVAYLRSRLLRQFLTILGVAPFVALVVFANSEPIAKLLDPQPARVPVAFEAATELPPILFIIFDELPLTSLLDEHEQIDPVRYPAFAKLAGTSTWFRAASAVHAESILAVPAILTGQFPDEALLPTATDHPDNLFSLLGARYRIVADEPVTSFHGTEVSGETDTVTSLVEIASDLRTIYLHFLLPVEFATGLPSLSQMWKGFGEMNDPVHAAEEGNRHTDRVPRLVEFTASIDESAHDQPTLYFLHTLFPHPPWEHLPSGRMYFPGNAGIPHHSWGPVSWWAEQGYQQHLLQLSYTDAWLGRILERMERADLFDSAIIIVTADHGATFWPNNSRRGVKNHPEDVMSVPLLIKAPHQREAQAIDRMVETVDILPSVADLLGIEMPWAVDGCSAFDDGCLPRTERLMAGQPYPIDVPTRRESLALKLGLFGSGSSDSSALGGLFEIGPRPELIGRRVRKFGRQPDPSIARVVQGAFALASLQPEQFAAARVTGLIIGDRARLGPAQIAVSTRGIIRAVVPALPFKEQGLLFSALIPERFAPTDPAQLKIFAVEGTAENTKLHRLQIRYEAFRPH